MRRRCSTVLALGLLGVLAGCNFSTNPTNTAAASSDSAAAAAGSGGATSGSGGGGGSSAGATVSAKGATLHWEMPTENTNGTPLTDLAGYTIVYGESPQSMNKWVQITDIGTTSYIVNNLGSGTWYFAILSYTTSGANSALSNLVTKTIP